MVKEVRHGLLHRVTRRGGDTGFQVVGDLAELVFDLGFGAALAFDSQSPTGGVEPEADRAGVAVAFRVDGRLVLPNDDLHCSPPSSVLGVAMRGCLRELRRTQ